MNMSDDEKWMRLALNEAIKAGEEGEVPVGAVLVKDGILIAQAHNQPILTNDPTAHAEIQLLRAAGKKLNNSNHLHIKLSDIDIIFPNISFGSSSIAI